VGEFVGDVGVALGGAELGVAQYLLNDADVDAVFEEQRGGGVAGVVARFKAGELAAAAGVKLNIKGLRHYSAALYGQPVARRPV